MASPSPHADYGKSLAVVGIGFAVQIAVLVERAGTAQPHQRAAAHLYLNIAAHQRLGDAVFIGVAQTDVAQMPRLCSRFFGIQRQAGRAAGTLQLVATNFVIGSVITDGFQRATLVGNAEPRKAVIFSVLLPTV